jgi:hypothetical protein
MRHSFFGTFGVLLVLIWGTWSGGQEVRGPFKVTIKDGKALLGEPTLPIDMTPRIAPQYSGRNNFGLTVEGKRITCSQQGSIWGSLMVDGNISNPFNEGGGRIVQPSPLPATASGKKRLGTESTWSHAGIHITQIIEIVPSKSSSKAAAAGQKRLLDTCRMTYILENKDKVPHKVAFKTSIDILIVNNDGALYASPTTAPGKILNGVALQGKELPEYLWVLERPDLKNPGFIATMTLKHSKGENPHKIVLANLGVVANFQVWDVPPQPAGESACALFWEEKELKPGQRRELVWGYGGGISTSPESEGRVSLGLSGSFEPNKRFTIAAQIEDPLPDQVLALELPAGMERVEGREVQPVALAAESGGSTVLWKARVLRPGDYEIRVRSSTGTVKSKHVRIEAVDGK